MGKFIGRPKGSKNKAPLVFREKLRLYCEELGVDPFEFMAKCLKKQGLEHIYKIQCAKELAKYLEPQLRSVEMEMGAETRQTLRDVATIEGMSADQRQARLATLLLRRNGQALPAPVLAHDPEVTA